MVSDKWVSPIRKHTTLQNAIKETGLENDLRKLEQEYNEFTNRYSEFKPSDLYEHIATHDNCFVLELYTYLTLPNTDAFYTDENIKKISSVVKETYGLLLKLEAFKSKVWAYYNK